MPNSWTRLLSRLLVITSLSAHELWYCDAVRALAIASVAARELTSSARRSGSTSTDHAAYNGKRSTRT